MHLYLRTAVMLTCILLSFRNDCISQINLSKYEIGLSTGLMIYQGDLTPSRFGSYRTPGFTLSAYANRIVNSSFSLLTQLTFGKIRGDDSRYNHPAWRQQRNFNFNSPVFEVSELLVYYPVSQNRKLVPYIFAGAGLSLLNIKRDWSQLNTEAFSATDNVNTGLSTDVSHRLPKLLPVLPAGIGGRYALTNKISLTVETSYRLSYTDYLDGFSKSANPNQKDHYFSHTIGILYSFGKKSGIDCPVNIK